MANDIQAVTVYCASSSAVPEPFLQVAADVGAALAGRGWELVYGGGAYGMMGRCANAALAAGGRVTGVITDHIAGLEVAHEGLTSLEHVRSMHERKQRMTALCDAFLVLPGGFGTLDETFEAITWKQLGIHAKPIVLLNQLGFFDHLLAHVGTAAADGFIHPEHLGLFYVATTVEGALDELANGEGWQASGVRWWLPRVK